MESSAKLNYLRLVFKVLAVLAVLVLQLQSSRIDSGSALHHVELASYPSPPVVAFGGASPMAADSQVAPSSLIVGMASTPDGRGYWLVGATGEVLCYGDAVDYGSAASAPLYAPIVGMASTPDGRGYWLVGADGGIFTFGDATFYGSMGGKVPSVPI
ncbi:MAG: hypothetical protein M0Z39_08180, partial [Actinomycetota bacterium]|nr:hypothetical protein [Actinomycetota bacterium]